MSEVIDKQVYKKTIRQSHNQKKSKWTDRKKEGQKLKIKFAIYTQKNLNADDIER